MATISETRPETDNAGKGGRSAKKIAQRVAEAAKSARKEAKRRAEDATQTTAEVLDSNPLGAIAGAIAFGAVAAALIPASRRELEALGPIAERLRKAAEEAFHAAREAGVGELTTAGLSLAAASDGLGGIVGKLVKAATAASSAAATSVRDHRPAAAVAPAASNGSDLGSLSD